MENNELEEYRRKDIQVNSINNISENRLQIDSKISNLVKQSIDKLNQKNPDIKKKLEELGENLRVVRFKDGIEDKINNGEFIWDGGTDIRRSSDKRFASKVELDRVDLDKLQNRNAIESIGKQVTSIVGQAQLYDIAEKIEKLTEKVDRIYEIIKDYRDSELQSAIRDLRLICIEGSFSDREIDRINNTYIHLLSKLSIAFEKELKKQIGKDIYKDPIEKVLNKFKESFLLFSDHDDERERLIKQLQTLSYVQQGYILSTLGLIKCYELTGEAYKKNESARDFRDSCSKYQQQISKYICYLINDKKTSVAESNDIIKLIKNNEGSINKIVLESCKELAISNEELDYFLESADYIMKDMKLLEQIVIEDMKEDKNGTFLPDM